MKAQGLFAKAVSHSFRYGVFSNESAEVGTVVGDLSEGVARWEPALSKQIDPTGVIWLDLPPGEEFVCAYIAAARLNRAVAVLPSVDERSRTSMIVEAGVTYRVDKSGAAERLPSKSRWRCDQSDQSEWAVVLFTSGTSGSPLPVVFAESALLWGAWNTASLVDEALGNSATPPPTCKALLDDLRSRDPLGLKFFSAIPMGTVAWLTVMHRALLLRETVVFGPSRVSMGALLSCVRAGDITHIALAPQSARELARYLTQHPDDAPQGPPLSIGIGGGAVSVDVADQLEEFNCFISVGYGTTELGGVALATRWDDSRQARHSTVGRPLASVRTQIVPSGEDGSGRLYCTSPAQGLGVLKGGALERFGEWIDTGDVATELPEGGVRVLGRADWVISRGGRRLDPVVVEEVLEAHPAVVRAGVVPVPSAILRESDIVALLELYPDRQVSPKDLRAFCLQRLNAWQVPRRFAFTESVPTAVDGGIRRGELQMLAERLGLRPSRGCRSALMA